MNSAKSEQPSITTTATTYVALLALLGLTLAAAQIELGRWNFMASSAIATLKAMLIVSIFMQVRYSSPLIRLVAAASVFWIAILFGLILADYFTRT